MTTRLLLVLLFFSWTPALQAQLAGAGSIPVEITVGEGGEQRFEGGVAIAEKDVVLHYGATSIYADYIEYNPDTKDAVMIGNVRLYRDADLFVGDRALYNLETKKLRAQNFRAQSFPFFFQAQTVSSMVGNAFEAKNTVFSTADSSKSDFRIAAKTARIYPKDHVTLSNATVYIGKVPVFWFPYIYQSLKGDLGFNFIPGYNSTWGAYLLLRDGFPISGDIHGVAHFDLRSLRGVGFGFDILGKYGADNKSWVRFQSYSIDDQNPDLNPTAQYRLPVAPNRYRLAFQDRTFFTSDLYASFDFNKLSDYIYLHDFNPREYQNNPQPDNVASLTKWSENYTLTAIARVQGNEFFDTTERLPEVVLDIKRQPLFGLPIYYESETGGAALERRFGSDLVVQTGTVTASGQVRTVTTTFPASMLDYGATRFDTFHQITMPQTLGGWFSIVPRIGFRGTYYSQGASSIAVTLPPNPNTGTLSTDRLLQQGSGSDLFRTVFDTGVEASFKFSREWNQVQSRSWGFDGLRHVVQPFTDFSFVRASTDPSGILQFDRLNPSAQRPSFDFPQFTTLDSIPNWSIWRFGVRNRLQTRRDEGTVDWLSLETYVDYNLERPNFPGFPTEEAFSNVINTLRWIPLPWLNVLVDFQLPLLNPGFTQVNTSASFRVSRDFMFTLTHRYLNNNAFFAPGSTLGVSGYYRINDNWGFGVREEYEFMSEPTAGVIPGVTTQEYQIHRDLSSWVASLGLMLRRNMSTGKDVPDTAVTLTFALKDFPTFALPVSFDPASMASTSQKSP